MHDHKGLDWELRYFRDVDRREVDFIVINKTTPFLMVECKLNDRDFDRSLGISKKQISRRRCVADFSERQQGL